MCAAFSQTAIEVASRGVPLGASWASWGLWLCPQPVLGSLPGHVSTEDISSGDEEGAESPQPPGGPEEAGGVWRAAWAGGVETGARSDAAGGATGNQGSGVWAARPQRRSHRRGGGVMSPLVPGPSALSQPAAAARGAGPDRLSGAGGGADRGNEPPVPPAPRCPRPAVSSQVSFPSPVFNLTPGVSLPPWASRGVPVWGGGRLCTRRCSEGVTCAINACRHRHRPARRVPVVVPLLRDEGRRPRGEGALLGLSRGRVCLTRGLQDGCSPTSLMTEIRGRFYKSLRRLCWREASLPRSSDNW